jgi:hypothetical protein
MYANKRGINLIETCIIKDRTLRCRYLTSTNSNSFLIDNVDIWVCMENNEGKLL